MSVSAITSANSSYVTTSSASSDQVANPDSTISKTDFLEMFITKLENQDPTDPIDDSTFTSDMAQLSTVEQLQNLNTSMTSMSTSMTNLDTNVTSQISLTNTGQAVSLVNKTVTVQTTDSAGNVSTAEGTVTSVKFVDGVPKIVINGVEYDTSAVTEVAA
jgi:flagellar basal-body rod modification protein FlgD